MTHGSEPIEAETPPITELRHVRSSAEKRAAEEIANRERCEDFDTFKPLFEQVQKELDTGSRETRPFERKSEIEQGRFFILGGQKAYIAEVGELFTQEYGDRDARLRVRAVIMAALLLLLGQFMRMRASQMSPGAEAPPATGCARGQAAMSMKEAQNCALPPVSGDLAKGRIRN
jgi:hypothetical protein